MSANLAVSGSNMQIGDSSKFYYADVCECEVACAGESGCLGFVNDHDEDYCKFKTSTVTSSNTNKDFWARDSSCTTAPTCTLSPPPSSHSPSAPPPLANTTLLVAPEWTDHTAFRGVCLFFSLVIVACGACACCCSCSPCYIRVVPQSKQGETKDKGTLDDVYNSLPQEWKNAEDKLAANTKEYFGLHKSHPIVDEIVNEKEKKAKDAKNDKAAKELLRGVELRHVLKDSIAKNEGGAPLSMRMNNKPMFELSMPQTQLFAFLSHVRHSAAAHSTSTAGAYILAITERLACCR